MVGKLDGKVALVTGGSIGLGRAAALKFAQEGAKVVVADLKVPEGMETIKMINDIGGEGIFLKTDVSKADQVESMVQNIVATYGHLDCVDNNAGIMGISGVNALLTEITEADWDRVIGINLKGVWLCMKYEILQMLKQGSGTIVNISSIAGLVGLSGECHYVSSKHGVIGLTRAAAIEYGKQNIRVNAVCPGVTVTPLIQRLFDTTPGHEQKRINQHPLGRLGTAEQIANAVVWLCSDEAAFVHGAIIPVDGGFTAQ